MLPSSHPLAAAGLVATALAVVAFSPTDDRGPDSTAESLAASMVAASTTAHSLPDVETLSALTPDEMIEEYCVRCHSDRRLRGNLTLERFSLGDAPTNGATAEKMIRKLRAGMMPPSGSRQPGGDSLAILATALENRMDDWARQNPDPGSRTFQRLNRAEYRAAMRSLFEIEVDVDAFLPLDTKSANFDNIADVQMPSATLMEGYLRAAAHVSQMVLGDPDASPTSTPYRVPRTASQKDRVNGAPIGTRGGTAVEHTFPASGRYVFQVMPYAAPEGELFGRTALGEQVEISVDGARVAVIDIDRWMSDSDPSGMTLSTDSIFVEAGVHRVAAAFVKRFDGPVDDLIRPLDHTLADTQIGLGYGVTTLPHLQTFTVVGPFGATGVTETPTRRRLFTCRPTRAEEARPCAESILAGVAERAYRRPLTDNDVTALMGFYDEGAQDGGFEGGLGVGLQAILASPHFVFRTEEVAGSVDSNGIYRISDVDLASRLSFFLWGTLPDAELVEVAEQGQLSSPDVLEGQIDRMLADPRSEALSTRFAAQWLRLQDVEKVHPDALDYPYFDATLAESMVKETELLFDHLVHSDGSVLELLTADYTFVNERLARHYGIPGVTGSDFRKVSYGDLPRRGLLGHGSVLTLTSHANRTSPVLRGKWVMEVLLGSPPPPPPPDVPELEEEAAAEDGRVLSVRERMEQHRANPTCNSCHRVIDPIGLALENYDVTGAWRIKDAGNPVDPVGELYDGSPIQGPDDLREALLARSEVFLGTFTENLMAYALGRRVEFYDMPVVRQVIRDAAAHDHAVSAYIKGVATSAPFLTNRIDMTAEQEETGS
ncbi:MAG: DUF1592 domain-containing protein [Gemmatimonadetes bacterium]|nr:DUF1592 domain-containing protein [Gemmatimonadota bacterium]